MRRNQPGLKLGEVPFHDHSALRYLFTKQDVKLGVDIEIRDKKGAENRAADHLSRLENLELKKLTNTKIKDMFPKEKLMSISDQGNEPIRKGGHGAPLQLLTQAFSGKLKLRWYGPFTVSRTLKSEAIELCDKDGNEFIVNRQC
ncbi:hypothetical protein Tco_1230666, partial [Tanacetum coccineum]